MAAAKFPVLKDMQGFVFDGTPIDEDKVRELATGKFIAEKHNAIFVGGTGTGKLTSALP